MTHSERHRTNGQAVTSRVAFVGRLEREPVSSTVVLPSLRAAVGMVHSTVPVGVAVLTIFWVPLTLMVTCSPLSKPVPVTLTEGVPTLTEAGVSLADGPV